LCSSVFSDIKALEPDYEERSSSKQDRLYNPEIITSAASLAYLSGDDLNLMGSFLFDFPFLVKNEKSAYLNLHLSTTLSKEEDFSFKVYDTDYQITIGLRDYFTRKIIISAFISQQGTERADANGSPYVRFVGFSMESSDYRDYSADRGLYWYSEIGAVFAKKEVDAEIVFKGDLRWNYLITDDISYGLDFQIDSLIDDFNTSNDWHLGPRLSFCPACSHAPSISLYYVNSDNPIGINDDGFMLEFDYRNKRKTNGFKKIFPDINGQLSSGAGEGREAFHFGMKLRSPSLSNQKTVRATLEVDQHMLTGSDTGELYYFLIGGLEYLWNDIVPGAYFYHRSNHQLAEPNDRIHSRNILEAGISSKGWNRKELYDGIGIHAGSSKYAAQLNFLLRGGYLFNSTFGESRRWNIRSGVRIDFPLEEKRFSPFLSATWEGGEVSRKEFHVGMRTPLDLDLAIVYRKDEQYYGVDKELFLFEASLFY
jgi:hypothetical protein